MSLFSKKKDVSCKKNDKCFDLYGDLLGPNYRCFDLNAKSENTMTKKGRYDDEGQHILLRFLLLSLPIRHPPFTGAQLISKNKLIYYSYDNSCRIISIATVNMKLFYTCCQPCLNLQGVKAPNT